MTERLWFTLSSTISLRSSVLNFLGHNFWETKDSIPYFLFLSFETLSTCSREKEKKERKNGRMKERQGGTLDRFHYYAHFFVLCIIDCKFICWLTSKLRGKF